MDDYDVPRAGAAVPRRYPHQQLPVVEPSGKTDNVETFSEFYRQFVPTLVSFLMWQGARLPDATDIAQDTMIKAYRRWSEIDHPQAWVRTVASRALVRHIASIEEDPVELVPEHSSLLPSSINIKTWERRHEILRGLDHLPPRQRQVMAWTVEGYTPTEIAAELRITPAAVRANLRKARRALTAYLSTGDER